jgi:hypothetical protein
LPISVPHACKVGLGFKSPYTGARYHQRNHWQHDPSRPTQVHSRKVHEPCPWRKYEFGFMSSLTTSFRVAASGVGFGSRE